MKKRLLLLGLSASLLLGSGAWAERWFQLDEVYGIDEDSIFDDPDGYTRFVSRELDAYGNVLYKHKEAVDCKNETHHFRKMYGPDDSIDNHNDADVEWTDWRTNSREVYSPKRVDDIIFFLCYW